MSNEELEVVPTTDPAPAADPVDTAVTEPDASAAATQAVADVITAATGTEPDEDTVSDISDAVAEDDSDDSDEDDSDEDDTDEDEDENSDEEDDTDEDEDENSDEEDDSEE